VIRIVSSDNCTNKDSIPSDWLIRVSFPCFGLHDILPGLTVNEEVHSALFIKCWIGKLKCFGVGDIPNSRGILEW